MKNETIEGIKITAVGELMLCLEGEGKPIYKFIYKKAAGVYWDENNHGLNPPLWRTGLVLNGSHILPVLLNQV